MTSAPFLPFARPMIGEEEIAAVTETMRSGWLTTGPKTKEFEVAFAAYVGMPHAIAVNSATAGLHLALEAIGVGPGDKVITTNYTFTATAEVIRYMGAEPVFIDVDRDSLLIDLGALTRALETHRGVKAIMPVHFGGLACDMTEIMRLANAYGVKVVEDAAHALPASDAGRMIGTIGDITVFSFYANKTMTTGEGGMIVTGDSALAKRMQTMRLHGINRDVFDRFTSRTASWYYEVVAPGFKYNITDIASAIGIVQLSKSHDFQRQREAMAARYMAAFARLPVRLPQPASHGDIHSWHLFVLQLDLKRLKIDRARFLELMQEAGVGTSVHYIPLHRQPYWRDTFDLKPEQFPVSEAVFECCASLPIWHGMKDSDVDRVIDAVTRILTENAAPGNF